MKVSYKGYDIDVRREKSMAGYGMLFFSVIRQSDGFICIEDYTEGGDTVREIVKYLKETVDEAAGQDDPWCERCDQPYVLG